MKTLLYGIKIALFTLNMKRAFKILCVYLSMNITFSAGAFAQDTTNKMTDTLIIKIKEGAALQNSIPSNLSPTKLFEDAHLKINPEIKKTLGLDRIFLVHVSGQGATRSYTDSLTKHFLSNANVEYAQNNVGFLALSDNNKLSDNNNKTSQYSRYNDPELASQWGVESLHFNKVSSLIEDPEDVTVALIDSGLDFTHPDLGNLWINNDEYNGSLGVDDDRNGYIDDIHGYDFSECESFDLKRNNNMDVVGFGPCLQEKPAGSNINDLNGHGTHLAGIIGAKTNNNLGMTGIAPSSKIMVLKALEKDMGTSKSIGGIIGIARAIVYAVDYNADIINMSFAAKGDNPLLNDILAYASGQGSILVGASGRGPLDTGPLAGYTQDLSPGQNGDVILVGGIKQDLTPIHYNKMGTTLSVMAPGDDILSMQSKHAIGLDPALYRKDLGSSFAASFVTGLIAIVKSIDPTLNAQEIRSIIEGTATDLGEPGFDITYGYGVINPTEAVCMISEKICTPLKLLLANKPPTILDLRKTLFSPKDMGAIQFLTYDEHQSDDVIVLSAQNLPEGMAFNQKTRKLSWKPFALAPGSYTFSIIANDGIETFEKLYTIEIISPGARTVQKTLLSGTPSGCASNTSPLPLIILIMISALFISRHKNKTM